MIVKHEEEPVPSVVPLEDDDPESETATEPGGNVPGGASITDEMFIGVEGITKADLAEHDKEQLLKNVTDFLLINGYSISNVEIVDGVIVADAED